MNAYISLAMSAFALRKRLLNQQTATTSPNVDAADETILVPKVPSTLDTSGTSKTRSPKKTRKTLNVQSLPSVDNEPSIGLKGTLPGNLSLSTDNTVLPSSLIVPSRSPSPSIADDEILVKPTNALPVQLSKFKPSKSNYQKRKDGRILLKLSDGEVCFPCSLFEKPKLTDSSAW